MAKNDTNLFFLIGGIVAIVGVLLYLFDQSFAFWEWDAPILGKYYISAFGTLHHASADPEVLEGSTYSYAAYIILAGGALALFGGVKGTKAAGILGAVAIIAGLAYFVYSHVEYLDDTWGNTLAFLTALAGKTGQEMIWGSQGDIAWRLGNGFFVTSVGGILALVGAAKSS